jgi:hypothetical protein
MIIPVLEINEMRRIIKSGWDTHFDPKQVDVFLSYRLVRPGKKTVIISPNFLRVRIFSRSLGKYALK